MELSVPVCISLMATWQYVMNWQEYGSKRIDLEGMRKTTEQ